MMTKIVMPTLRIVKTLLTRVLNRVPMASSTVNSAVMATGPHATSAPSTETSAGTSMPKRLNASAR